MLEQEIASIIKFVIDNSDNPAPYYHEIPQSFTIPAVYFPTPEIASGGDALSSYALEYSWFIKFFHESTEKAYPHALQALVALKQKRNLVPLIDETGEHIGKGVRIKDPAIRKVDDGVFQLSISWISRRLYDVPQKTKMQSFDVDVYKKPEISEAMENAIEQYLKEV